MTGSVGAHGGRAFAIIKPLGFAGAPGACNPKHVHFADDRFQEEPS
jgi:hypothetical protein